MRIWIRIIVVGLGVFAGLWLFSGLSVVFSEHTEAANTGVTFKIEPSPPIDAGTDARVEDAKAEDPLVPPARVPGLPTVHPTDTDSGSFLQVALFGDRFVHDNRAFFQPHGNEVCSSGCALTRHPTDELTGPVFQQLMTQFAREPIDETSPAFETLLYFGPQTKKFLDSKGTSPLDPKRAAALRKELSRTHAKISIRVVDEHGVVQTSLPPTRVPLDRRHVFEMDPHNLQPLQTSGTVKRVGLYHLWSRL